VDLALRALAGVRHRGAVSADAVTGDGAGLLLPIPRRFLARELGPALGDPAMAGIATVFVGDQGSRWEVCAMVERAAHDEGLRPWGWRRVPTDDRSLGSHALLTRPRILQAILRRPERLDSRAAERRALRVRRRVEASARAAGRTVYVASCSFETVTYKALVGADRLGDFYPDLRDPDVDAAFAIFHQRYSTNTAPTWERAQPFRMLCHNGEINSIAGNANRMRAREGRLGFAAAPDEERFRPALDPAGSDSEMLDEVAELLVREGGARGRGRDIGRVMATLVPAAWEHARHLDKEVRGFYRWHASIMEPWDGPAALIFTDGERVGASLDRNGLRPLRYAICEDGLVICASEAGVVDTSGRGRVRRGKLGPGEMLLVDPRSGSVDTDPIGEIARRRPYRAWVETHRVPAPTGEPSVPRVPDPVRLQVAHGYTREELSLIVRPAASNGKEPTFSMGDDTAIPPLGARDQRVPSFLRQRFAQVTNPALDHVRERGVMSIGVLLGARDPLLWDRPEAAALIESDTFFLWGPPAGHRLDATWPVEEGAAGMSRAIDRLAGDALSAVRDGHGLLIVSQATANGERVPVPSVLAVGAVNAALVRAGSRTLTSIVAEADDVCESHDAACLLAAGAEAIHPRLALATVAGIARPDADGDADGALTAFRDAIEEGVRKAMARLGISSLDSYRGAEAMDVLGLAQEVVERCFLGLSSVLGGRGFDELGTTALARHRAAYGAAPPALEHPGAVKYRKGGDYHATNPDVVRAAHRVVDPWLERLRSTAAAGRDAADERRIAHGLRRPENGRAHADAYRRLVELVWDRPPTSPRDLFDLVPAGPPIPLHEVEPVDAILRRFSSGAISHGAISAEAHRTLALGMRLIGGRSNTGEGGEDPDRFRTPANAAIKQIASGRFGVTPEYCAFAEELQIKIAQGSKPGEGGQLPGFKVTEEIARLRHTHAGIALISPAPHHDIYSIEDLAQLVFDLRQVNPDAEVSVKLVAEEGVGTVAVGVAKARADIVHIAGADGGTGASPLSSIKHAGLPWELGLAEAQRELSGGGLRDRVRIRVDGGLKTGRDVLAAAILGADEFSFGTAALLAEGCLMVRTCHLDTCPVGIATQRPELRRRFAGTPEMVATYFTAVAEEIRTLLVGLGLRSLRDVTGRTELLRARDDGSGSQGLDPSVLLEPPPGERRFVAAAPDPERSALGDRVFEAAWPAIHAGRFIRRSFAISNADRSVGARLGGAIAGAFGPQPPPGSAAVSFRGQAGQSFGAFLSAGVSLFLTGEANDYVGKAMAGGTIAISPPENDAGRPTLAGNAVLYGATGGELFVAGRSGERFAVRNSGATAVVEGVGHHGCEYMTGGTVVVLGPTGPNLGAGMTGGEVIVLDDTGELDRWLNDELVVARPAAREELDRVWRLVSRHHELTGSALAAGLLANRPAAESRFRIILPRPDVVAVAALAEGSARAGGKAAASVAVTDP
jgi:glutamate synthase (ferredoxin)